MATTSLSLYTAVTIDNCCATSASSSSGNSVGSGDDDNYFRIRS